MTATIHDRGYSPYRGQRGGRSAARRALFLVTVRRALGLRRDWRQKVFPWGLLALAVLPAVVNVGVGYLTRNSPLEGFEFFGFREYVGVSTMLLVFVALTAPDVVCPDRRNRVLPLILARPLTGLDYIATKVAAITAIVFAFSFVPQVVLYLGQALVSKSAAGYAGDHLAELWQVPVSVAILAIYYSVLGVTAAALTTRRVVAAAIFLGTLLAASIVVGILAGGDTSGVAAEALDLVSVPLKLRDVVFLGELGDDSPLTGVEGGGLMALGVYVTVLSACAAVLHRRYRWIEA